MERNSTERQLAALEYTNRVSGFRHPGFGDEMKPYVLMQQGDPEAVEAGQRRIRAAAGLAWSGDALRNAQYLLVAAAAIAARFAILGGMEPETAYTARDLYIRKADLCRDEEEVYSLHREMFSFYTGRMAGVEKEKILNRDIVRCAEYIDRHLHRPIRLGELAEETGMTPGYLSVLFRKETGETFTEYVMRRRIETAENMLRNSEHTAAEISEALAFSSQSYFIRCFRKRTGKTPAEFRRSIGTPDAGEETGVQDPGKTEP